MSRKFEAKNSKINGKGLFATSLIKKGETVIAWNPRVITIAGDQLNYLSTCHSSR